MSERERGHSMILIIILALLVIGAFAAIWKNRVTGRKYEQSVQSLISTSTPATTTPTATATKIAAPKEIMVTYTLVGFSPATTTVKRGDKVTFTNRSNNSFWPQYSGTSTAALFTSFDSKKPILPGQSFSYTFDATGTWAFRDHLRMTKGGAIIVK